MEKGKQVVLGQQHDVTSFCGKGLGESFESVRYHAEDHVIEATDKMLLIRVPVVDEGDEYPEPPDGVTVPKGDVMIPAKLLSDALKRAPVRTLQPILNRAVQLGCRVKDQVCLVSTDLNRTSEMHEKIPEGVLPDFKGIFPTDAAVFTVKFRADLLSTLAKYAMKHGDEEKKTVITFKVHQGKQGTEFLVPLMAGGNANGIIMPVVKEKKRIR